MRSEQGNGRHGTRLAVGLAATVAAIAMAKLPLAEIIRTATGIGSNAQGLGGLVAAAHKLTTPLLVAAGALAPLGALVGGIALVAGHRSGMRIIGSALGGLVFVGVVTGLVD